MNVMDVVARYRGERRSQAADSARLPVDKYAIVRSPKGIRLLCARSPSRKTSALDSQMIEFGMLSYIISTPYSNGKLDRCRQ